MRSKFKTKSAIGQLERQDGTVISENQKKANLLNSYFASFIQKEESEPLPDFEERQFTQELTAITVTVNTILKATDKVKSS